MAKTQIKVVILTILITLSLFFLLNKNFLPGLSTKTTKYQNEVAPHESFKILGSVIWLIKDDYVDIPNPGKTMEGAFKGLLDSLDILSSYLDKTSVTKLKQSKIAPLKEPGIILYKKIGTFPVVLGVKENSPAEKNGIKIGESISSINNKSTLTMSMLEANLCLKDVEETPVKLKIVRTNTNEVIDLERISMFNKSFSYSEATRTHGILTIHQLYSPCVSEIKEKIIPKLREKKKPLILDMRNCSEGQIEEARKLVNIFIEAKKIGSFEKKGKPTEVLSCPEPAELKTIPLVIWVNQATIGPAEIVAGALKIHKRAKIIGVQTPGLAARQNFFPLEDGSGLMLTSAIFRLDPKQKFWMTGIKPDIKIKDEDMSFSAFMKKTSNLIP